MKWTWSLLTVLAINIPPPPAADACGVKLTVKSKSPRKAVARSSNPSNILLLGNPPARLRRDLSTAGHNVEVAREPASAKKPSSYTVVIADKGLEGAARSNFAGALVVVRSADITADLSSVEKQVARRPTGAASTGVVVAAREAQKPIAAGPAPEPGRRIVAAPETKDAAIEPPPVASKRVTETPKPEPAKPAAVAPKRVVTEVPRPEPAIEKQPPVDPKPKAVVASTQPNEVYFTINSTDGGARGKAIIAQTVRWLTDNASLQVTIEGHADPSGDPEYNKILAQKRADWVYQQLIDAGINASRLEVTSYGDTRLKYGASDYRNRRIAIVPKSP